MSAAPSVCVIGDCSLDVSAGLQGPMVRGGDHAASIALFAGGQGANVAVRLARRGLHASLVTVLADDLAGAWLRRHLAAEHVDLAASDTPATTLVVTLLDEVGERTMLSDRARLLIDGAALASAIGAAGWVHCSGYLLRDAVEARYLIEVLATRSPERRVSIAGGSASEATAASELRSALERIRPNLLIMSLDEARWLVGDQAATPGSSAEGLARSATIAVVTAGPDGADAAGETGGSIHVPAPADPAPVIDATGAGDAFAAALVATLCGSSWPPSPDRLRDGLQAASRAGAQAARVRGAQGLIPGERGPATVARS